MTVPDSPTTVLGAVMLLGTFIVGGLVWTIRLLLSMLAAKDTKIDELQQAAIAREAASAQREREISKEEGPLLAAAAEALKATPDAFERAVSKVVSTSERDQLMRRLEHTVDELTKRRRAGDDA